MTVYLFIVAIGIWRVQIGLLLRTYRLFVGTMHLLLRTSYVSVTAMGFGDGRIGLFFGAGHLLARTWVLLAVQMVLFAGQLAVMCVQTVLETGTSYDIEQQ